MVVAIREYIKDNLLFAVTLNLEGCVKEWFKNMENKPSSWVEF